MAKKSTGKEHNKVIKKTSQNGSKTSTVNKNNTVKKYRGQGR